MKKQIFLYVALLLTFYACESADIGKRLPQETVELSSDAGESVDLGLSVMWADRNLDGYYAWGEIESKIRFSEDNYEAPFEITASSFNNISGSKYDAARMNWGGKWRMPTYKEYMEFVKKCSFKWTGREYEVTGPSGKKISLPSSDDIIYHREGTTYWTASADQGEWMAPLNLTILSDITPQSGSAGPDFGWRGGYIRPVCDKK